MGIKSKRQLNEDAVPTKFSFSSERKRRESSEKRANSKAKRQCIDEAVSSRMSDDEEIIENLECEDQMIMLDKSVCTESIKTVDKCIGNHVVRKSVHRPQQLLKLKIFFPNIRDKCVNTEFSFPPNKNRKFYSDTEGGGGDEVKETETEFETETENENEEKSDSIYIPEYYAESSDDFLIILTRHL